MSGLEGEAKRQIAFKVKQGEQDPARVIKVRGAGSTLLQPLLHKLSLADL
ncbi:hypothetical protein [Pseudovibrio sp. Tun.PSC04-5.I4]|nr:hypothetical protein [Pseudovibrio sp. Tun.PSC04-5.I4]